MVARLRVVRGIVGRALGLGIALAAAWIGDQVARRESAAEDGRGERFRISTATEPGAESPGPALVLRLVEVSWSLEEPGETWGEEVALRAGRGQTVSFEAAIDLDPGPEPYGVRPALHVVPHPPGVRSPSLRRAELAAAAREGRPTSSRVRIDVEVPSAGGPGRIGVIHGRPGPGLEGGADSLPLGVPIPLLLAAGRRGHVLLAWLDDGPGERPADSEAWRAGIRRAVGDFALALGQVPKDFSRVAALAESSGRGLSSASWIPVPGLEGVLGDVLAAVARNEESWARGRAPELASTAADARAALHLLGRTDPRAEAGSLFPPGQRFAPRHLSRALRAARLLAASEDPVVREAWASELRRFESPEGGLLLPFLRRSLAHGSVQGRWPWPAWAGAMADEGWPGPETTDLLGPLPEVWGVALLLVLFVVAGAAALLLRTSGDAPADGRGAAAWLFAAGLLLAGLRVEIRGVDTNAEAAGFLIAGWGGGLLLSRLAGWGLRAALGGTLGAGLLLLAAEGFGVDWPIRLGIGVALFAPLVGRSLGAVARRGAVRGSRGPTRWPPAPAQAAQRWLFLVLLVLGATYLLRGRGSSGRLGDLLPLLAAVAPIAAVSGVLAARRPALAPPAASPGPCSHAISWSVLLAVSALVSWGIVDLASRRGAWDVLREEVAAREARGPAARREAERLLEADRAAEAGAVLDASLAGGLGRPGDREETHFLLAVVRASTGDLAGADAALRESTRGIPGRLRDLQLRVSDRVDAWIRRATPRTARRVAALVGAALLQGAASDERWVTWLRTQPGLPSSLASELLRSPVPGGDREAPSDAARRFLAAERVAAVLATRGARALATDLAAFAEDPATPAADRTAAVEILCRVADLPFTLIPADRPGTASGREERVPQGDPEIEDLALSLWAQVRSLPRGEGLRRRLDVAFGRLTDAEGQGSLWLRRHVGDFAATAETWRAWWTRNRGLDPRLWLTNGHPLREPPPEGDARALLDAAFPAGGLAPAENAPSWRARLWHLLALAAPEEADVPTWGTPLGDPAGRSPWLAEPLDGYTPWCATLGVGPKGHAVRVARFRMGAESEPPSLLATWTTPIGPGEPIRIVHGEALGPASIDEAEWGTEAALRLQLVPAGLPSTGRRTSPGAADERRAREEGRRASPRPPLVVAPLRLHWRPEGGLAVVSAGRDGDGEFRLHEPLGAGRVGFASVGSPRFPMALGFDPTPGPGEWSPEDWRTRIPPHALAAVRTEVAYLTQAEPRVPPRLPTWSWISACLAVLLGVLGLALRKRPAGPLLAAGATIAGVLIASLRTGIAALDPWPAALGLGAAALGALGLYERPLGRGALLAPAWLLAGAALHALEGVGIGPGGLGVAAVVWGSLGLVALPFLLRDPDARTFEAAGRGARLSVPAVFTLALVGLLLRLSVASASSGGPWARARVEWTSDLVALSAWMGGVLLLLLANARGRVRAPADDRNRPSRRRGSHSGSGGGGGSSA